MYNLELGSRQVAPITRIGTTVKNTNLDNKDVLTGAQHTIVQLASIWGKIVVILAILRLNQTGTQQIVQNEEEKLLGPRPITGLLQVVVCHLQQLRPPRVKRF